MLLDSGLGFSRFVPRLATPSVTERVSSSPTLPVGESRSGQAETDFDWKLSTLARLRAQQSTDGASGSGMGAWTRIDSEAAAREAAVFARNEMLSQVTTALRAQVNMAALPLRLLTGPDRSSED